jgi:DNA primase
MVETSILAAALETVDRVGPCEARIKVTRIEDTRNQKRKTVIDRAKLLLKTLITEEIPDSREISELVREEVKVAEVAEYGPEKLPCGPNVQNAESLILAEGRADVINLLKNDIKNVVAVGGANVPTTLAELCRKKEITAFLDGDRGGDIILNQLSQACDIDFVARAPPGREVEELTRKEIIKCLRRRVPMEQIEGAKRERNNHEQRVDRRAEAHVAQQRFERRERGIDAEGMPAYAQQAQRLPRDADTINAGKPPETQRFERHAAVPGQSTREQRFPAADAQHAAVQQAPAPAKKALPRNPEDERKLQQSLVELEGTLRARIYGAGVTLKSEVPVRDLMAALGAAEAPYAIVFDGIITQRLVDLAEQKGARYVIGIKAGNMHRQSDALIVSTIEAA